MEQRGRLVQWTVAHSKIASKSRLTRAQRLVSPLELLAWGVLLPLGVDALVVVDVVLLWFSIRSSRSLARGDRSRTHEVNDTHVTKNTQVTGNQGKTRTHAVSEIDVM